MGLSATGRYLDLGVDTNAERVGERIDRAWLIQQGQSCLISIHQNRPCHLPGTIKQIHSLPCRVMTDWRSMTRSHCRDDIVTRP